MKNFISIIFVGALVVLGVMISRGTPALHNQASSSPSNLVLSSPETTNNTPQPSSSSTPVAQGGGGPTGTLYLLNQTSAVSEIVSVNINTKQKKTIFSDKSSSDKLQYVSSVTGDGDTLVALLSKNDEPAGQLVAIKTDGSGSKTVIAKDFASSNPPVLSPDRTKLALVSFSNAEPNYGFSLVLMNVDGSNKKTLATDQEGIANLAFSPDGRQIAYLKGATSTSTEIATVTIATGKVESLYKAKDKIIADFDWSPIGLLAVTEAVGGQRKISQAEVYLYDPKNKTTTQITRTADKVERTPKVAPDASGVAFIQAKDDPTKPGDVIVTFPDGNQPINVGTANQILGWIR